MNKTQGQRVGGRFLLQEILGQGAQSVVWLARDMADLPDTADREPGVVASAPRVAVKLLCPKPGPGRSVSRVRPSDLLRMRHEAAALAVLGHPAIVGLVRAGVEDGIIYLALEYCPGDSLERLIARRTVQDPIQVARWGTELCDALAMAHGRGILHRDIKPGNVILTRGRARLLDFGMASVRGLHADLDRGVILGTLPYMPLEAWGLGDELADGRADIYGLAATLYELLTGRRAFAGASPSQILEAHRCGPPTDPCLLEPRVPRSLGDVLLKALAREPGDRYQTAAGMGADLRRLAGQQPCDAFPLGRHDSATRLVVPRFVGREDELEAALDRVFQAAVGEGGIVLVESEPGGGRSRFLTTLADRIRAGGGLVLAGRCHGLDHDLPYDAAVQALAHFRAQLPLLSEGERGSRLQSLRHQLQGRTDPVLTLVPSLQDTLERTGSPTPLPGDRSRSRFVAALRDALLGTAAEGRPTMVLLDDVHRADDATRDLLLALAREVRQHPVLLLVSAVRVHGQNEQPVTRSMDGPTRNFLLDLAMAAGRAFSQVSLKPMDTDEVSGLAASMLRCPTTAVDELAGWLERAAEGNPLRVVQLVRELVEAGAIRRDPGAWRVDMAAVRNVGLPADLADGIRHRVESLDDRTRRVLAAAATLGAEFRTDRLARMMLELGTSPALVLHALDLAERAGLIRNISPADADFQDWRFPHELMRRELAGRWPLTDGPRLHAAVARILSGGRRPEDLDDAHLFAVARHALMSPDPSHAVSLALRAGSRALATFAHASALELFTVAARRATGQRQIREALLGQGRALLQGGRPRGAVAVLDRALDVSQGPDHRAEVLACRGEAWAARCRFDEADVDLFEAARLLGVRCPATRLGALLGMVGELVRHPLLLLGLRPRRLADPDGVAWQRADLLRAAGRNNLLRRPALGLYLTVRGLRCALQHGSTGVAARVAGALGLVLAVLGRPGLASRLLAGARRLLGPRPERLTALRVLGLEGAADLFAGRLTEARQRLSEATAGLADLGEFEDRRAFQALLGLTLRDLGDLRGFRHQMEELHHASTDQDHNEQGLSWASFGLAWDAMLRGSPERALAFAGPALASARKHGDHGFLVAALGRRARMHAAAGLGPLALADAREVEYLVAVHRLRGWFAGEGRTQAALGCLEAGEPELAARLLPRRRELRRLPVLLRIRDAVAARSVLVLRGDGAPLRAAATALIEAGMLHEAAEALLVLHEADGDEELLAPAADLLRRCPGAGSTLLGRRVLAAGAESALQESASRLARHLDGLAASRGRRSGPSARTTPVSAISSNLSSSLWASTMCSDQRLRV